MLRVIGAGYGRTGTSSLKIALETLGFGKCYHMENLMQKPHQVAYWKQADAVIPVDWDRLFANYQSVVDFPAAFYFDQLADYFSDAKVILTVRDPENWYESMEDTILQGYPQAFLTHLKKLASQSAYAKNYLELVAFEEAVLWGKNLGQNPKDRKLTIAQFNQHIEEVQRRIPSERLLVYRVADGWRPLCEFLDVAIPEQPFPRARSRDSYESAFMKTIQKELDKSIGS